MSSNLPPGCSVNDIPGNRREDSEMEFAIDQAVGILTGGHGVDLTPAEIIMAATAGVAAVTALRESIAAIKKAERDGGYDDGWNEFYNQHCVIEDP